MNIYKAIQIRALLAVMKPDSDAELRRIMRWYSKTFHTPLSQVEEIPIEDLLQIYYEEKFDLMEEEDLEKIKMELLESDGERAERLKKEEEDRQSEEAFMRLVEEEAAQKKKMEAQQKVEMPKPVPQQKIAELGVGSMISKDSTIPDFKVIPPDITMRFDVDPKEFEAELDSLGIMDEPKK